jgi:putative endonuclease
MKQAAAYIMTNQKYGTLYTGVSSNLRKRVYEHRNHSLKGFTSKYECTILVYYEIFSTMINAIKREKQIKAGSRNTKLALISSFNSDWLDLYPEIIQY